MTAVFTRDEIEGIEQLSFANEGIALRILPSLGGKIISLRSVVTEREFLLSPRRPYAPPVYGGAFPDADFSGWDECFPAIAEGPYPDEPWRGTIIPDHGEVWTLPWTWRYRDGVLHMATHGVRFPYRLERWLDLRTPDHLRVRYRASNLSPFPFRCLWSPHPMLGPAPSWRILLPPEVSLLVDSSTGERLGPYLNKLSWPTAIGAAGEEIRVDLVGPPEQGYAHKVFAQGLVHGWAGIHDTATDEALLFSFSPATLPFVGVAVATGSAEPDRTFGYYAIIEPCNGWPDSLATAAARGASLIIPPLGTRRWEFEVRIETAFSQMGLAKRRR